MHAFPVLGRGGSQKLREVIKGPKLVDVLHNCGLHWDPMSSKSSLLLRYDVGLVAHFNVAGYSPDSGDIVLHAAGLPAGIAVSQEEVKEYAQRAEVVEATESSDTFVNEPFTEVCIAETLATCSSRDTLHNNPLRSVLASLQRKHLSVLGHDIEHAIGTALLHDVKLGKHKFDTSFRYHVGLDQSMAVPVDVSDATCSRFGVQHKQKILSPLGVAACVGVAQVVGASTPQVLWHVSGNTSASIVPALQAVQFVDVGESKLDFNGPHDGSLLMEAEDPCRYLNPDEGAEGFDTTRWLCHGLFNTTSGQPHATFEELGVVGVGPADLHTGLDLFCRHKETSELRSLSDWSLRL